MNTTFLPQPRLHLRSSLWATFKIFCLFLGLVSGTLLSAIFSQCFAAPRLVTLSLIIVRNYDRQSGARTRLVRWETEATVLVDGKPYQVVQGKNDDPSIRIPAGNHKIKVQIKGHPNAKLVKIVTTQNSVDWDADATGSAFVRVLSSGEVHLVFDMPPLPEPDKPRLPIIFLPGVAGTELRQLAGSKSYQVWPFVAPPGLGGNRFNMVLDRDGIGNTGKVRTGDILRSGIVNFYGSMINFLVTKGYKEDRDLFIFPYDWRLYPDAESHFNRLDQLIQKALKRSGSKKVNLVAHSLGGVVARSYLISRPTSAAKVSALISMGTPYWGSVKPYYALLDGYDFDNPEVTQKTMKILARNFPSAHALLPQAPFLHDINGKLLSLDEAYSVQYKGYVKGKKGIDDYTESDTYIWNINGTIMDRVRKSWARMGTIENPVPLPSGVKHYAIIGSGNRTMDAYKLWLSTDESGFMLGDKKVEGEPMWSDGDITVPLKLAEIKTADAMYYVRFRDEGGFVGKVSTQHGDLPKNPQVQNIVWQIVDGTPPDGETYSRPSKYQLETTDFALHSDAHLSITAEGGGRLGFNKFGGMDRTLRGGDLVAIGEAEYASAPTSKNCKVAIVGIRTGKFTLNVNRHRRDGTQASFSYREVKVQKGTVAQFTLAPNQSAPPTMKVTTAGKTNTVKPTIGKISGSKGKVKGQGNTGKISDNKGKDKSKGHTGRNGDDNDIFIEDDFIIGDDNSDNDNDGDGGDMGDSDVFQPPTREDGDGPDVGEGDGTGEDFPALNLSLEIGKRNGKIVITSLKGNPFAEIMDLKIGDHVISIDGKSTDGLSEAQARDLMRGKSGSETDMTLKVRRVADGEVVTITMPHSGTE